MKRSFMTPSLFIYRRKNKAFLAYKMINLADKRAVFFTFFDMRSQNRNI
jgi:hypothetical protein